MSLSGPYLYIYIYSRVYKANTYSMLKARAKHYYIDTAERKKNCSLIDIVLVKHTVSSYILYIHTIIMYT